MKRELVTIAEGAVRSSMPMLLLRGADLQARDLGDLDFLVPKGRAIEACQLVAATALESGWYLLCFRDIGYLATVVLARPAPDDGVESVKLDFFSGVDWYGAGCAEITDRVFRRIEAAATSDEERRAMAGAVNFIQKCMTNGRLTARDLARVKEGAASPSLVLELCRALGLPMSANDAEGGRLTWSAKWKLRAASGGVRDAWSGLRWLMRAASAHVRFKVGLRSQAGMLLALSGLDGSGKSTQMERVVRAYASAGVTPLRAIHLLPSWIPMPHQLLRRKATSHNYTRPYSEAAVTSQVSSAMRLTYYIVAFLVAKAALWWAVLKGDVVIMDRSFTDFAADLARARIPHRTLPEQVTRACAPLGCLAFIDARPQTVVQRKGELTPAKAAELRDRYREVVRVLRGTVIDGDAAQESVFRAILACIDSWYRARLARAAGP